MWSGARVESRHPGARTHLRRPRAFAAVPLLLTLFVLADADAEIRLPAILDSHAVLQRDREIPIWATPIPGSASTYASPGMKRAGSRIPMDTGV